jgi:hypothetical protein
VHLNLLKYPFWHSFRPLLLISSQDHKGVRDRDLRLPDADRRVCVRPLHLDRGQHSGGPVVFRAPIRADRAQNFAAANLKGTNLPAPAPAAKTAAVHKTLPHALGRAAAGAAGALGIVPGGGDERLARALSAYAGAWERVGDARVQQDSAIQAAYLAPWKMTLSNGIDLAMKARVAVRTSRLELDAAKQS